MPEFVVDGVRLVQADCLELMALMSDDSVDLIATDPPYYKVVASDWDRQWKTKDEFMLWLDSVLAEFQRILKPTGSLYLFCNPYLAAETEMLIGRRFHVLNHIVWKKNQGRWLGCNKESLRKYFPQTERIIFAESRKPKPFVYEPVRAHLADAVSGAGLARKDIDAACSAQMSSHWFGRSQFSLPSREHYETMQGLGLDLKPYDDLKSEFVALRDGAKGSGRSFSVSKFVPYTDVWEFPVVKPYPGRHPCEKPLDLMRHIIESSSLREDLVFDAFAGSGSTAIAARNTGRNFLGTEMGFVEFEQAVTRITE
jgi:site-specific DNA-methyltransferase (adenine-specific)